MPGVSRATARPCRPGGRSRPTRLLLLGSPRGALPVQLVAFDESDGVLHRTKGLHLRGIAEWLWSEDGK